MGDMAFVPQYFSDGADANSVCLRFGGGFELMKAGRDVDGVWTLIESAIWYVLTYWCTSLRSVNFPTSIIAVTSHVPWIVPIFTAVARKSSNFKRSRDFCRERTLQRLQMGANRKDLFYYLVSFLIEYLTPSAHSKLCDDRAARISLKMSVRLTARLHRTGSWPSSPDRTQPAAFSPLCSIISYATLECMNV